MHRLVRNDLWELDSNEDKSALKFDTGDEGKKYDFEYQEPIGLEVRWDPQWSGRLERVSGNAADTIRTKHPDSMQSGTVQEQRLDVSIQTLSSENATRTAAIDVGANSALVIVTSTGETAV